MALLGIPQGAVQAAASGFPINQQQTVNEPFVWGEGGRRMTPEDIALQREIAERQRLAGADFSPVGSIWEGLGRVGQGVMSGIGQRDARRASEANAAESDAVLQALLSGETSSEGGIDPVMAALANPNISEQVRGLAELEYKRRNPAPGKDPEAVVLARIANDPNRPQAERVAAAERLTGINDPFTSLIVGGNTVMGRQSQVQQALQGGGGLASMSGGMAPDTLPPDFNFDGGQGGPSIENTPAPTLGNNGMPSFLTPEQYQATVAAMGKEQTDAWARRNNVRIGQ